MIKTILVPLDGSERAECALPLAARVANRTGSTLVLVRVVHIVTNDWPVVPYPLMMQSAVDGELGEANAYLERVASFALLSGMKVVHTARHGVVAPVILATATQYHADLIIMDSHGRTGMTHILMGSVAENIARHSSVPVLIMHEKAGLPEVSSPEIAQPLRVLVPVDGSAYAETALEPAATLLMALAEPGQKGAIRLVRVVEPATDLKDEMHRAQSALSKVETYLDQTTESIREGSLAPEISQQQIEVSWCMALDTDVAKGIVRMAENGEDAEEAGKFGGCQLVAMSTHGRGGLQRLTMGSITERVLHSTKRPVLVVRPAEVAHKQGHPGLL